VGVEADAETDDDVEADITDEVDEGVDEVGPGFEMAESALVFVVTVVKGVE